MVSKITRLKVPTSSGLFPGGTLLTTAASVSPTWRIPNRPAPGEFKPLYRPSPTLALDCPLFELTPEGAAHWMAMEGWTQDEAALLLAGANPLHIREFDADPNIYKPDYTSCGHLGLTLRLQRAHEMAVLAFPCPPLKVLTWAKSKHAIPAPFEALLPVPVVATAPTATPVSAPATDTAPKIDAGLDFTILATRKQLIDAFGGFTGMDAAWFDNLNTSPKLKAARKFTGQGGRGHIAEPLFCPYEVMQWVANPKRKKGKPLSGATAWRLLKSHFGKVYDRYSIGDPNVD